MEKVEIDGHKSYDGQVKSSCLQRFLLHSQTKDPTATAGALAVAMLLEATAWQIPYHLAWSCNTVYQKVESKPVFYKSCCTISLHLIFGPWNGLADSNSPINISLCRWSSIILSTCPSHLNVCPSHLSLHSGNDTFTLLVILNSTANCSVVICSLHCTWQNTPRVHMIQWLRKHTHTHTHTQTHTHTINIAID